MSLIVLCAAAGSIAMQLTPDRPRQVDAYYYDLNTQELFVAPMRSGSPIKAPSDTGGEESGVLAFVFACGDCTNPANRFIGMLQRVETGVLAEAPDIGVPMIRRPDDEQWFEESSNEAAELFNDITERCPNGDFTNCLP